MKSYKTITVPSVTKEVLSGRVCDLCGKRATNFDWDSGMYEVNETEIKVTITQREGDSYPEGGSGTRYEIDLCPDCFTKRLVPWLKSEGALIEQLKWDF